MRLLSSAEENSKYACWRWFTILAWVDKRSSMLYPREAKLTAQALSVRLNNITVLRNRLRDVLRYLDDPTQGMGSSDSSSVRPCCTSMVVGCCRSPFSFVFLLVPWFTRARVCSFVFFCVVRIHHRSC